MNPFIGQIILFGGNFAPRGWAKCDGQLLPISQYSALFSILGTTYGGDGVSTFALPDLRGRVPLSPGSGPGLSSYQEGQKGGAESVTLTTNQLPSHSHTYAPAATTSSGDQNVPGSNSIFGSFGTPGPPVASGPYSNAASNTTLKSQQTNNTGNSQSVGIRQPYLALQYIIAMEGVYPSRS